MSNKHRGFHYPFFTAVPFFFVFLDLLILFFTSIFSYLIHVFSGSASFFSKTFFSDFYQAENYSFLVLITIVLLLVSFHWAGIYSGLRGKSVLYLFQKFFMPWFFVLCILSLFVFLTKTGANYSRLWLVTWLGLSFVLIFIYRVFLIQILKFFRSRGFNTRRIILIGSGALLERATALIKKQASMGYVISAVLDPSDFALQKLSSSEFLKDFLQQYNPHEIWIALPLAQENLIKSLLHQARFSTTPIYLILDFLGQTLLRQEVFDLAGLPVVSIKTTPIQGLSAGLKFLEDKFLSLIILILLSPVMLIISLLIKLNSKGPVLYKQLRYGLDNQAITVYKFRTMCVHQEEGNQLTQATKNDARVTSIGKFLRRTSLDELPQFLNVLQGRMSIVGPRPHAVAHNELYKNLIDSYMLRHLVKPGITGWAQVNGLRGEIDALDKMQKRVEYDLFYIENWSLSLDIKIIFMTLYKGFVHKNAY